MKDFYMGAVVEVEELALGANPPETTPPHGVIVSQRETDGWTRRYLYRRYSDLSGKRVETKVLYSEMRPEAGAELGRGMIQVAVPFQPATRAPAPAMDGRVRFPMNSQVKLVGMGQAAPPAAPPAAAPTGPPLPIDQPVPLSRAPVAPGTPPPPALPAVCDRAMQLPDGTILNPDDNLTFKDFCALLPYIMEQKKSQAPPGPVRPGGPIPLSNAIGAVPSFGPAGSPFGQGGGGGGGGGGPSGPGPIGVVNSPVIQGAGQPGTQGPPGAPGATGPAGPGSIIDGVQLTSGFTNAGVMAVVPGSTFGIVVGGDGKCQFNFGALLLAIGRASIWDVQMGIQIDATQYLLWESSEEQGAGADQAFVLTADRGWFTTLPLGPHTISLIYGYGGLNRFDINAGPAFPASISCQHS